MPDPSALRSIAILAPERYGDVILLTPLLAALRNACPQAALHVVAFKRPILEFLQEDPNITRLHYAKGEYLGYVAGVLSHKFDLLFDPKESPSFNFLLQSVLIRARCKVAHRHPHHEGLFDHLLPGDFFSPVVDRNLALMRALDPDGTEPSRRPYLPPMPLGEAMLNFADGLGGNVVGINISASTADKYWPEERWQALLAAFPGERFVILASPRDQERKRRLETGAANVLLSPPTANLGEAGAIIGRLKLLVSLDTSLVHVAACHDVPVAALYRNDGEGVSRFSPLSSLHRVVLAPGERVDAIGFEPVRMAVESLLEEIG